MNGVSASGVIKSDNFIIVTFTFIIIHRTRLTLSSFDRRDEGTYYCVSKNEMGITRGNIQVFSELRFDKKY